MSPVRNFGAVCDVFGSVLQRARLLGVFRRVRPLGQRLGISCRINRHNAQSQPCFARRRAGKTMLQIAYGFFQSKKIAQTRPNKRLTCLDFADLCFLSRWLFSLRKPLCQFVQICAIPAHFGEKTGSAKQRKTINVFVS